MQETQFQSLGPEDPLEKEMATNPSILACRIPDRSLVSSSMESELGAIEWISFILLDRICLQSLNDFYFKALIY